MWVLNFIMWPFPFSVLKILTGPGTGALHWTEQLYWNSSLLKLHIKAECCWGNLPSKFPVLAHPHPPPPHTHLGKIWAPLSFHITVYAEQGSPLGRKMHKLSWMRMTTSLECGRSKENLQASEPWLIIWWPKNVRFNVVHCSSLLLSPPITPYNY